MKELILNLLILAYGSLGIVGVIAYWPTIKDLYVHKKPSANTTSYLLWTITTGITLLYSMFILPDLLFRIVSGLNFVACAIIWVLSMRVK